MQAQQQPAAHSGLDLADLLGGGDSGSAPAAPSAAPSADPSDIFGGIDSSGPAAAAPGHRAQPSTELDDLFGGPAAGPPAAASPPLAPQFPPITAWEKDGLRVSFEFDKPAGTPSATEVMATYTNSGNDNVSDFTLQVHTAAAGQCHRACLQLVHASLSATHAVGCLVHCSHQSYTDVTVC